MRGDRTQGRVFHMTQKKVRAAPNIVVGTLQLNPLLVYALIDPRVTHSFVANKIIRKLGKRPNKVER